MLRIANISVFVVLFGQLGFSAATYYVGLPNPSIPFWAILYAVLAVVAAVHGSAPKASIIDVLLFVCFGSILLSYSIYGEGDRAEFAYRVLLFVIGPYICGRVFGKYVSLGHFSVLYAIAITYLLLMGLEFARAPESFLGTDRLRIFIPDEGGSPVGFYLGTTFGAALTVAVAFLTLDLSRTRSARFLHLFIAGVSFIILVLWGARGSLLAAVVVAAIMFLRRVSVTSLRTYGVLFVAAALVLTGSFLLTGERRVFIEQIPAALSAFSQSGACVTEGDSVLAHITLLNEAWRLFSQAPLFGIGASNYGLYYCGNRTELASPHSTAVHIIVELGLVGMMIWATAFVAIVLKFVQAGKVANDEQYATASVLFFLWLFVIFALQTSGNLYYDYHLYLVTGLLVAALSKIRYSHSEQDLRPIAWPNK